VWEYTDPQQMNPAQSARAGAHVQQSSWVGWIAFGGCMMVLLGSFHVIDGLVALFNDDYLLVGASGLLVSVDLTAWGWAHVVLGLVMAGAGYGLFAGHMWARVVGVLVALVSAVVNLGFLAAYPFWSAIMIALDVLVIWAITMHGSELRRA
jgi:hypothetical protein